MRQEKTTPGKGKPSEIKLMQHCHKRKKKTNFGIKPQGETNNEEWQESFRGRGTGGAKSRET